MKRPLTTLIFVISWFAFSILSIIVDSKTLNGANSSPSPLNRPPRSLPPSQPPPSPPPPPPPPPIVSPPPPRFSPLRRPPGRSPPFPVPRNNIQIKQGSKISLNKGETVGLFFVGIAAVLQICVVGFLVFKRRQLLRSKDRYDGLS